MWTHFRFADVTELPLYLVGMYVFDPCLGDMFSGVITISYLEVLKMCGLTRHYNTPY